MPPHTLVCVLQASVLIPSHSNTLHILTPFLNVMLRQNLCPCYASQCNVSHCKTIPCVLTAGCADSIINHWLWPFKSPNLNFICGSADDKTSAQNLVTSVSSADHQWAINNMNVIHNTHLRPKRNHQQPFLQIHWVKPYYLHYIKLKCVNPDSQENGTVARNSKQCESEKLMTLYFKNTTQQYL